MLLMIDNYDSFTYNLVQYFGELGQEVQVIRNDAISVEEIGRLNPQYLVISPGPCAPAQAGVSLAAIKEYAGKIPLLGVCLGHQAIGEVSGGKIVRAAEIIHGKVSPIRHNGRGLYAGLPQDVEVGRYHSLIIDRATLPDCLEVTSELADGTIMGVRHKEMDIEGIQFHPESILTPAGRTMMQNFLDHLRK